jgi:predicted RecB family nuclease
MQLRRRRAKMRVKNKGKKPIRIGRRVLPKGAVGDFDEQLLLQPRIQKLRKIQKLVFPFHKEDKVSDVVEETEAKEALAVSEETKTVVEPDDFTLLIHIGSGRAQFLKSAGILTFEQLVERADEIESILGVTSTVASEIVESAETKVG